MALLSAVLALGCGSGGEDREQPANSLTRATAVWETVSATTPAGPLWSSRRRYWRLTL